MQVCELIRLGLIDYQDAWELQSNLAAEIAAGTRHPTLLLLEHPHTFTFGRSGRAENLLWSSEELERRQVKVFWVDRGGDITYHGPGQLVGYPLLPLVQPDWVKTRNDQTPKVDIVGYLRKLEWVLIAALTELGLPGCQAIDGLTGVWVPGREASQPPAKIASIGVKVDAHGITRHGFALNIQPDMRYWKGIIGCGLVDTPAISLVELVPALPPRQVVEMVVVKAFGRQFGFKMVEQPA